MKVRVIEWIDGKNGKEGYFKEHYENQEYPETEGRHCDLCVACGWSTYPECRSWCQAEEFRRLREQKKSKKA